jgi:hypothetical protein
MQLLHVISIYKVKDTTESSLTLEDNISTFASALVEAFALKLEMTMNSRNISFALIELFCFIIVP